MVADRDRDAVVALEPARIGELSSCENVVSRSCSLRSLPALVRCARFPLLFAALASCSWFAALTGREAAGRAARTGEQPDAEHHDHSGESRSAIPQRKAPSNANRPLLPGRSRTIPRHTTGGAGTLVTRLNTMRWTARFVHICPHLGRRHNGSRLRHDDEPLDRGSP